MTENILEKEREDFKVWLIAKELSERTLKEYLYYYDKISKPIDQEIINLFCSKYRSFPSRAFLLNYLKFLPKNYSEIKDYFHDLEIPEKKGRTKKSLPRFVLESEALEISKKMLREKDALSVLILFYAGLRIQEMTRIKVNDFNWNLWWSDKSSIGECKVLGKGSKERIAFVPSWLMKRIEEWITNEFQIINPNPEVPIFKINHSWFTRKLKRASRLALGRPVNPHALRHGSATWLLKNGMRIEEIKEFLGHTSVSSTEIYLHLEKSYIKKKLKDNQKEGDWKEFTKTTDKGTNEIPMEKYYS
jgi:integrase/recombinase XerD